MNYMRLMVLFFATLTGCLYSNAPTEKKLVIVITSFNNAQWYTQNLGSVFSQEYSNYRVIYVDDCSTDGTPELVEHYIHACNQTHRVTLIKNKTRQRALANLYMALQLCEPDEIVFNYDGDDWFAHTKVFSMINELYQDPSLWITYGSFINWPTNEVGYCQEVPAEYVEKQLYRQKWWKPGQLRTFYAWLFQQVKLKDLLFEGPYFQGQFFPANSDLAIYYPMMEMAGSHYKFIPELIYIRNVQTPLNDFKANKEVQILGSKLLRAKEKYPKLSEPLTSYFDAYKNTKADVIFFSKNPQQAQQFIASCKTLLYNYGTITILYENENQAQAFQQLADDTVTVIASTQKGTFKDTLMHCLQTGNDYVFFAHDGILLNRFAHCSECIDMLERTFAYAFFLHLGQEKALDSYTGITQPLPALNYIKNDIYAWAFHYADSGEWRTPHQVSMALYRSAQLYAQVKDLSFSTVQEMLHAWQKVPVNLESIGLCYEQPKISYCASL